MTIDKQKLKALAEAALDSGAHYLTRSLRVTELANAVSPETILALLAEIERLSPPAGQVSYQQQMEAWKSASSQDLRARGELMIQIEELEAENEALRKDAERYRYMRKALAPHLSQDEADAQTDAAMAKEVSHG